MVIVYILHIHLLNKYDSATIIFYCNPINGFCFFLPLTIPHNFGMIGLFNLEVSFSFLPSFYLVDSTGYSRDIFFS